MRPRSTVLPLLLVVAALGAAPSAGAQARKPARGRTAPARPRTAPARPAARPQPAKPAPKPLTGLTAVNLGAVLKALGYEPAAQGGHQRVKVDHETYGYFIDVGISKSGDWLVCMAHLAPVEDLTKVPAAPLLTLLSMNDALLGMYFSYDRVNARLMLNATIPNRALDADSLRSVVEGLKATVHRTRGLWDTASW